VQNFAIMSEYMTPMGRIMSSTETGLRRINQRRIAKAIRRSIGLGLMPSVHRHPEILYKQNARLRMQIGRLRPY
jgi:small subunit ribosomal protein S18